MKGYAVLRIYVLSTGSCSFGRKEDVANILSDTASSRPTWSRVAGYEAVSPEAICVLTRMRLRHCWLLPVALVHYRRISRNSPVAGPGLIRFSLAVESPWTFHSISIWKDAEAIHAFGNIHEHVYAVRWALQHCSEIWSAEWMLAGLSQRGTWNGVALHDMLRGDGSGGEGSTPWTKSA